MAHEEKLERTRMTTRIRKMTRAMVPHTRLYRGNGMLHSTVQSLSTAA